ncbi:hypothetical protein QK281_09475 [Aeromonas hydrophila]|uniref:hypothetical protein n=1 Tax=Aeromonas hydrophila TaxID=644 RepID=UPI00249F5316|nr:hypothetical protein [Aeromonas hydrophila]WGY34026.1 hypothetical protein QK281_09475 [Aeromonas hydrophila]HDC4324291.1 hypothetical protein [Aeromonas hydrophila]
MNHQLKKIASKMNRDQHEAYIRRVMWISFEERLKSVFSEIDSRGTDASTIGLLYFSSCHLNDPKYKVKNIYRSNSINQVQISSGWRHLNVWHDFTKNESETLQQARELGASISFSQDITGKVTICLFPYKSDLASVDEDNIILGFGREPNALTVKVIRQYIKLFLRYCSATSMQSGSEYSNYLFRLWLMVRDIRNRKKQKFVILRILEKVLIIGLGGAAVWATLLTGNKLPF